MPDNRRSASLVPAWIDFLVSSLLAYVGGHMVNYTLILYLQERVGSDVLAGLGFGLCFGSSIIFGWFAGVLADRWHPARLIHIAHALFLLCLAGLYWAEAEAGEQARVAVVMSAAFCGGLAWSVFGSARLATLAQIVPQERLRPVTILFNLTVMIGFGLAPLLIGIIRSHAGWPQVIGTAMLLYVASSLALVRVRSTARPAHLETYGLWQEIGDGFRAVGANRLLTQLMLAAVIGFAVTGPLQLLLPRLAKDILQLDEIRRGGFLGLLAVALIGGGILALPLARRLHHGYTIFGGMMLVGALFASLAFSLQPFTAAATLLTIGLGAGLAVSFIVAGIQLQAPAAMRGRVMSMYSIISQVVPAASGVAAGFALKAFGILDALLLTGLGLLALAMIGAWRMPELRRRQQ